MNRKMTRKLPASPFTNHLNCFLTTGCRRHGTHQTKIQIFLMSLLKLHKKKKTVFCTIQGAVQCLLCKKFEAQQCTNNSTLSNRQTHRRTSISNPLRKCGKWKVLVPSPPRLLGKGAY